MYPQIFNEPSDPTVDHFCVQWDETGKVIFYDYGPGYRFSNYNILYSLDFKVTDAKVTELGGRPAIDEGVFMRGELPPQSRYYTP